MANYYIVSKGLEADSIQYLTKVLSSLLDSAEWEHSNLSAESKEEEIASLKACIKKTNPKVLISLGADASKILSEKFRFITSARGKLQDYTDGDYSIKMVITYSPKFLLTSDVNMDRYGSTFLQDLEYAIKYVNGQLIDISQKNLQYAKTFKEFEDYFNQYLKDAQLPAYDIETNGKDPRSDAFRIVGYSLAPNGSTGIYVIRETLEYKMPEEDWQKCVELTKDYISSRTVLVHNIMYERPATLNEWGINITNFEDSLIKARLLLGGRTGAGLKEQCARNLGYPDWDTDLHTFLGSMETMRIKLRPTAKGKDRNDYILLKEKGFSALLDDYTARLEKQETFSKEFETAETEEQAKEIRLKIDKIKMDSRQLAVKEAMETLTEVISQYYDDPNPVLELAGRQVITLIDIQHDGIIPYSSVPINIITKYGALDSVGTQDLNDYLSAQMTNESTEEVNLWNGYRILKANFIVGSEMELQGLYWNDRIASDLKVWLTEKAYDAMVNMIRSGLIDENIIENCKPVLLQIIKEELNTTVKDILGDFDLLKSGIKLKSTGKRITWLQLIDKLGKPFLDSHRDKILRYVKENITNRELYPNYTDMLDFFNPSSTSIVPTLKRIFLNDELQRANGVREVIAQYNTGLDLETIPDPDRTLYQSYMNIAVYNKKIDDEELEGTKISNNQIYKILAEGLSTIIPKTKELQAIQRKAATYTFEDTSESTILSIYENLTMIGCDIEDESTWTDEFRFLVNFRTFKKSLKLINVYIEGDKIGRGSVWVVNKPDLEDSKSRFTIRKRKYSSEISENETYLMQSSWGVCFTGDTKVKCLDGNSYSFEELVSKKTETLWVYACTNSGRIVPALATNIRKTQKKARLVEVELDSGEKIRCTPAHLFMLRDGSYKKAIELSPADSLMPLYLKHDQDGYILCMNNEVGKFQKVHILINKAMNPKGYSEVLKRCSLPENFAVTHHKDYNKENNEPSNLEWMSNIEHSKYHYEVNDAGLRGFNESERPESWKEINRQHLDLYNKSEKHKEVSKRSLATWKANNPEQNAENGRRNLANYRKNHHEEYIAGLKSRSSRPEHIALFKENGRIYRKSEAFLAHCKYMADTFLNTPENLVKASKRMTAFNSDPVSVRNQVRGKIGKLIKFLIDSGLEFNKETFDKHKVRGCVGYDNILKYFDSYKEAYSFGENYNHKVTAVRLLETTEDVYDLEVPEYHNFALDCGIFVHNCTAQTLRWRGGIHCLHPDTKILLTDNRSITVKDLYNEFCAGKNNYVYSRSEIEKHLVIELIRDVYVSGKSSEMVKIYLDNGKFFEVTPDHKMVMRDGSYIEAQNLKEGDSLYPISIQLDKTNHNLIFDPDLNKYVPCHYLSDNFNERYGLLRDMSQDFMGRNGAWIRHHIDFNPLNNNPENVHRFGWNTHDVIHKSSEGRKKSWERIKYRMSTDPEYYEKMMTQMRKKGYYQFVIGDNAKNYQQMGGRSHCLKYNSDPEYKIKCMRGQILSSLNRLSAFENIDPASYDTLRQKHGRDFMLYTPKVILKYFDSLEEAIDLSKSYNHKVVKVERIYYSDPIDVYSIAIHSDSPSYSLDCGVMSKNTLPAGPMVKGIYTSRYKGGVIAAPDYSQQEIRTISGLSNCQSLLEAYRNGEDVHMKTAMSVFKKPADQITKNERRFCKSATFAILYGSTVGGLANLMSVPMEQAQQMMDGFFGAYPELKVWMDGKHREVERYGKVSCPKVGYFLNIDLNGFGGLEEAYKQAGNYPIQGQSSLIAGYVLNSITQYLLDNDMKTKPISFIHDSLEFDIHPRELFISCQKITSMMNDIPNNEFGIPSKAELTIGMSMGDENEVTYLEEQEGGGIIELQGYENDLDAILENWREVYSSVEYKDDLESVEEIYVPRKEIFMPKLTISKYSGTRRKLLKRRFTITF